MPQPSWSLPHHHCTHLLGHQWLRTGLHKCIVTWTHISFISFSLPQKHHTAIDKIAPAAKTDSITFLFTCLAAILFWRQNHPDVFWSVLARCKNRHMWYACVVWMDHQVWLHYLCALYLIKPPLSFCPIAGHEDPILSCNWASISGVREVLCLYGLESNRRGCASGNECTYQQQTLCFPFSQIGFLT